MFISQGYSVNKVLKYAKVSNSTWYYFLSKDTDSKVDKRKSNKGRPRTGFILNPDGTVTSEKALISILKSYREDSFFKNGGGYIKLKHYLRRDYGIYVNHKRLYRICKENGLLLPKNQKKARLGVKRCVNREITGPNQLWQFDIKYGYVHGENRHFYLLSFIDIFYKEVVSYSIGLGCNAKDLKATLDIGLRRKNIKDPSMLIIRSDNGTQMTSNVFKKHIAKLNLEHEFTPPATPDKNAYIESFFPLVEKELFRVSYFSSYEEAYRKTVDFINFYNNKRIHGSLGYKSPKDFALLYEKGGIKSTKILRA